MPVNTYLLPSCERRLCGETESFFIDEQCQYMLLSCTRTEFYVQVKVLIRT